MSDKNTIALILIDGLRPDALPLADVPVINKLIREGASSLSARTVIPSVTLPCITSIFLSAEPEEHNTIGNYWNSGDWPVAGLIELFHQSGGRTASVYNWEHLRDISRPGSLDVSICLNHSESPDLPLGVSDAQVTEMAVSFLSRKKFDFIFIYLGCVDTAGHRHGWMSSEYLRTLENTDCCTGRIVQALPPSSVVVIASDHGGHGHSHGSEDETDMTVPLIFHGNGIPPHQLPAPVSVLDIAPTCAALAGLEIPREWAGKVLL
jgi:predicted AlkP superfamily pyrophosphatase or phosphodiesterase